MIQVELFLQNKFCVKYKASSIIAWLEGLELNIGPEQEYFVE